MNPDTVIVVGPGRLGLSLAADLAAGSPGQVAVVGRAPNRPAFLDNEPEVTYRVATDAQALWTGRPAARIGLVLAVGDDAMTAAAREWAERLALHPPAGPLVALHTSGFHSAAILSPIDRIEGAVVGGWHPLMAIAAPGRRRFENVTVGIEGEPAAVEWASEISRVVGAIPVTIPAGEKARYHAAAVFASNYLVACLGVALEELEGATGGAVNESALVPLARAAIENVAARGVSAGATGPLVRGDVRTVEGHLAALDPNRAAMYRALGRELLELVRQRLTPEAYAALRSVLGGD